MHIYKSKLRFGVIVIITFIIATCIDPYSPIIQGYNKFLVVEGLITDANTSYSIKLSRTFQDVKTGSEPVLNANVYITDDLGKQTNFKETPGGKYKTDSSEFRGMIGRKYVLHIVSDDQNEYISDTCQLLPVPEIDSIYYTKDQIIEKNGTVLDEGITIRASSKTGEDEQYFRWEYDETWKFRIPYPLQYTYINQNKFDVLPIRKVYCWKNHISSDIVISDQSTDLSRQIINQPVIFISSSNSDKLMIEYSILVKQYSISKTEYIFWQNLKRINETAGDIFEPLPYSVFSNIHNTHNSEEKILGYFEVSSMKSKRIFIAYNDLLSFRLPYYSSPCKATEADPRVYHTSFDDLYNTFCVLSDWKFYEPIFASNGQLEKLSFVRPECSDCTLTGSDKKPDFWIDK